MAPSGDSERSSGAFRTVVQWLVILLGAVAINLFLFTTVGISGDSMSPSLHSGDRALVPLWQNWWPGHEYGRGDIVFFPDPTDDGCRLRCPWVIKRIIGLPGETIAIDSGVVSINGQELAEPYLLSSWRGSLSRGAETVPADSYFVMGDNRYPYGSFDSRTYGPVPASEVAGRASAVVWPPLRRTAEGWTLNLRGL